jgi:aryl-alcohol dehydrogenase-like predicted oxidoreductase
MLGWAPRDPETTKGALVAAEFDLRTTAPDVAADLTGKVADLLDRAHAAGAVRDDLTVDEVMALARRIFDTYVDRGGNFIDTANQYTEGTSERLVGEFSRDKRERLVLATKYTLSTRPGDPNSGGNHRKSMVRSVEEVLRAMDDLVRAGKVLYVGISDTPAWQVSRDSDSRTTSWPGR